MGQNAQAFLKMYRDLKDGSMVSPRGQRVLEVEDYRLDLDMNDSPCTSFEARKMSLDYAKAEFWWYLRGDKFDRSIEKHATMWPKLVQPDGSYLSNYGQYIFGDRQFDWVVEELCRDQHSRRASIVLLRREHVFAENKDVVCTYGINFRIRQSRLNMSVSMRSNDAIFGTTNDVFAFSCLYRMVFAALRFTSCPLLAPGRYVHRVDSLHVYERHWDMMEKILFKGIDGYEPVEVPYPSSVHDLSFLLSMRTLGYLTPPEDFVMSRFLFQRSK